MRPRAILVTGTPGSGKSTLAHRLSIALRVPIIGRDDIRGGLLFSAGAWGDSLDRIPSAEEAVDVFVESVVHLLERGVSCIAEYVFRSHRPNDIERILAAGDCVVITTECENAIERFVERNRRDLLISQPAVLDALGYQSADAHTIDAAQRMAGVEREMLVDFPVPVLTVDTTDGYDPALPAILDFVTRATPTNS